MWESYALEINLRCGGTTHPLFALTSLTDGVYDPLAGEWRTRLGDIEHYAATDHLDSPAYQSLTPDDLLDVVEQKGLGWDGEREVGVVLPWSAQSRSPAASASPPSATRSTRRGSATRA